MYIVCEKLEIVFFTLNWRLFGAKKDEESRFRDNSGANTASGITLKQNVKYIASNYPEEVVEGLWSGASTFNRSFNDP